jgi:4-amino-4-deoxy-L-arabinose transferase-like glycosyltransferase
MKKSLIVLTVITLLGALLRFYKLGDIPVGFHRDEAILGYTAYSILKTGRDMSGTIFPLHLASFIYSPAGYSYASVPFIYIFGLTPFSVRFASAFFGTLTIILTFLFVRELLSRNKSAMSVALLASMVLSISPWHINLSRTATENTIVVFFLTLGVLLYLLWIKNNRWIYLVLSYISFGLTLTLYQAPRAFLPLFVPLLYILYQKKWKGLLRNTALYICIVIIPIILILSSPDLTLRLRTVSIFGTDQTKLITDEQIREDGVSRTPLILTRIFHNKFTGYSHQFVTNYFAHFSYPFLFADNVLPQRYKVPGASLLYLVELTLLLVGIWFLGKNNRRTAQFIAGWILLAPIGSALTFDDVPNLQRTLIMQPALAFLVAYGIYSLTTLRRFMLPIIVALAAIYSIQFASYLHAYYIHQIIHQPYYRQEGYKELVGKVNAFLPSYTKAVITNRETAPTLFFLFFGNYDPKQFQDDTRGTTMKDFDRISFGPYEFTTEECPVRLDQNQETLGNHLVGKKGALYVNYATCKTPPGIVELATVLRSDNTAVFKIVTLR